MLRLHGIVGHRGDPALAARLHALEHDGAVEFLFVAEADLGRRRLRGMTDRGTDCALSLDRDAALSDGAVLHLDETRAVVVRSGAPQHLHLRPRDAAAALKLGHAAGHLHWRVHFDDGDLIVLLDGPAADCRARIAQMLADGSVTELPAREARNGHEPHHDHGHQDHGHQDHGSDHHHPHDHGHHHHGHHHGA